MLAQVEHRVHGRSPHRLDIHAAHKETPVSLPPVHLNSHRVTPKASVERTRLWHQPGRHGRGGRPIPVKIKERGSPNSFHLLHPTGKKTDLCILTGATK